MEIKIIRNNTIKTNIIQNSEIVSAIIDILKEKMAKVDVEEIIFNDLKEHPYYSHIFSGIESEKIKTYLEIIQESGDIERYIKIVKEYREIVNSNIKNFEKILRAITFYIKNKVSCQFHVFINIFFKIHKKKTTNDNKFLNLQFLCRKRNPARIDKKEEILPVINEDNEFSLINLLSDDKQNFVINNEINDDSLFLDYNDENDYYLMKWVDEKLNEIFGNNIDSSINDEEPKNKDKINSVESFIKMMEVDP